MSSRIQWLIFLLALAALFAAYGGLTMSSSDVLLELKAQIDHRIFGAIEGRVWWMLSPAFLFVVITAFLLQFVIPAKPKESMFHTGVRNDFLWAIYTAVTYAVAATFFVGLLSGIYQDHFSFLTLAALNDLPAWARFLIAVILTDFLAWAVHYMHHKIPFLWEFHAVHHSQTQLNFFSGFRIHPLTSFIRQGIFAIVFFVVAIDVPTVLFYIYFRDVWALFNHSNLKLNLGPLRYILVTPQFHRIHHSFLPEHQDTNMGNIFIVWDYVFGTMVKDFDLYPETGILDQDFPQEQETWSPSLLLMPLYQMIYPFRVVGRQLLGRLQTAVTRKLGRSNLS